MSPRVARVSGTWTVTTSERASSVVEVDELDAVVGGLLGGDERVDAEDVISSARARSAMARPILPRPTMPERPAAQLEAGELGRASTRRAGREASAGARSGGRAP